MFQNGETYFKNFASNTVRLLKCVNHFEKWERVKIILSVDIDIYEFDFGLLIKYICTFSWTVLWFVKCLR